MADLDHPCVEWEMYKDSRGYGQRQHEGKVRYAHRIAYALEHGLSMDDIEGVVIRHACDNPSCVNPEHLLSGTTQDNIDDKVSRGRAPSLLTREQVIEIRQRYKCRCKTNGQSALAREFNVSQPLINRVVKNEIWRHV